ncbi:MAG TPA: hypothetical protein VNR42_00495 [Solirubrobacteraceae bacterium]|nr:hypothetical protein [Solirubrobacteraceae bacterium]
MTLTAGAIPALAQACTVANTTTTQAFKQFGDSASYTLAPSGSFESGATGWSLSGASVKGGSESYFVGSTSDSHSLVVSATSRPISPPFCVNRSMPTFRFFARQVSGGWSEMNVNVLWTDSSGVAHVTTAGGLGPSTSWGPTPVYNLAAMLGPLFQPGSTLSVRIQFVPASGGGAIAIDDLYVDPYRSS